MAEELSFTRAAQRLHTAQPSLSQQIRQLEKELGVKLLDRSRHHVAVTNAGRVFLQQAKDILGRVDHASRLALQAADGQAGDLSVGTFPSADVKILPALRPEVAKHLPDLRLLLHSKYTIEPLSGLRSGTLDVAFMRHPDDASGLEVVELLREQIVIVLPSHHVLARRKKIPVKSLDDLPCITMERSMSPALHDATAALYREARIRMHAVSSADNVLG
ncbi:MAG: LysR substrate-binding domain-containing protein, partial [Gammaproteobacteria bacterium]|nr:LysR substrate-binding domain-containing protein [Gammaproteobacteria bacterium]